MLLFALPVILTNLGQQFYMIADAAIVGRGIGVDALAAVGCTDWTYWVILWSVSVMTQGFATFVSRYFGKQDVRMINRSITMSALLSLMIALFFTVLGLSVSRPVLLLLDTPAHILDDALIYLNTMIAGTLIVTGYNLTSAILRAFGDSRTPLVAMIIAAGLNILLDLLFILVFPFGVFGAAFASVLSQAVSFVFCVLKIRRIDCVRLTREYWKPDRKLMGQIFRFGFPLAIQYMAINIGGMFIQSTVNLQGSSFIAGYTSVSKLYGLLESTAIALGAAFTTFTSQNFGAGDYKRVRRGLGTSLILALSASALIMAVVLPLSGILPQFFLDKNAGNTAEALAVGTHYLVNMVFFLPVLYLVYVYRGNFQSIGDSFWSMISGFGESAVRILMAKLFYFLWGSEVLFFIEPFAWLAALLFVMVPYYFCRGKILSKPERTSASS